MLIPSRPGDRLLFIDLTLLIISSSAMGRLKVAFRSWDQNFTKILKDRYHTPKAF